MRISTNQIHLLFKSFMHSKNGNNEEEILRAEVIQSLGIYQRVLKGEIETGKNNFYNRVICRYMEPRRREVIKEVDIPCKRVLREFKNGDKIFIAKNKRTGAVSYVETIKVASI